MGTPCGARTGIAWGPARKSSMFFISYGTRTGPERDPQGCRTATLRTRKGIDATRIGKTPARASYLAVRAPCGSRRGCSRDLHNSCRIVVIDIIYVDALSIIEIRNYRVLSFCHSIIHNRGGMRWGTSDVHRPNDWWHKGWGGVLVETRLYDAWLDYFTRQVCTLGVRLVSVSSSSPDPSLWFMQFTTRSAAVDVGNFM